MNYFKSLAVLLLSSLLLFSCIKDKFKSGLLEEAVSELSSFTVEEAGYRIEEVISLTNIEDDIYTEGVLEYSKKSQALVARVEFGSGTIRESAKLIKDGNESEIELERKTGAKDAYKKVIIEPLVKSMDCNDEITSGIIKFYEVKTGKWAATIDFGNGNCDDLASKETNDGHATFIISEYL